tara:strand:- start:792 stop:1529 length:738 start_codon:yes stop_codon:yes gene_type:complete
MCIIDKLECAFIPLCKVASSSLLTHFAEEVYDDEYLNNLKQKTTASTYRGILRKKMHNDFDVNYRTPDNKPRLEKYFSFAFVRNPWHRIVSAYLQFLRWKETQLKTQSERKDFAGLSVLKMMELMDNNFSFESFVNFVKNIERNHSEEVNHHWRSQVGRLYIEGLHPIDYNFIGRLESIDKDFFYVADKLNLKHKTLSNFNHFEEYNYKEFYTNKKLIDDVAEYYTRDIDVFKYEFDNPSYIVHP